MKKLLLVLTTGAVFLLAFYSLQAQEKFNTLDNIKADKDSVTVTLSGESKYHVFKISNPPRLIIEFSNTEYNYKQKELVVNSPLIKRVRSGQFKDRPVKVSRVVLDLVSMVEHQAKRQGNEVIVSLSKEQQQAKAPVKDAVSPALAAPAPADTKKTPVSEPKEKAAASVKAAPKSAGKLAVNTAVVPTGPSAPAKSAIPPAVLSPDTKKTDTQTTPAPEDKKPAAIEVIAQPVPEETPSQVKPTEPDKEKTGAVKSTGAAATDAQTQVEQKPSEVSNKKNEKSAPVKKTKAPKAAKSAKAAAPAQNEKAVPQKALAEEAAIQRPMLPKQPVNLDFENADIRDVLRILSVKSGINIIYGSDVDGALTLHLENVPFDKAFETILSLKGLVSQEQGPNILRVVTPLKISEERAQAVNFTKIFPLNYANADDVKKNLDSIRNAEGRRGNVTIDARTNSLIITDTPEGLSSAEAIITELDKKPYQVIIEAKLVEVILTDNFDMGIQWQYASNAYNENNIAGTIGATEAKTANTASGAEATIGGAVISVLPPSDGGTGVSFPADAVSGQIGTFSLGLLIDNNRLTAILSALSQKGLSRLLSNPRVTTLNNQTAKILIGQRVPFSNTTIGQGGVATTNTQWLEVGIKLEVNPIINVDQRITLKIKPEVSLVTQQTAAGPIIASRQADTTVMIKNNETVVIGGLIREEDRKLGTQVPLLGELPIIGHLFRRDYNTKERAELLVFITPQIIE